nr:DNRLRE domain-containing protein [Thermoanaerobaculia bacterium]
QIAVNHRNPNQMVAAANTWNTSVAACNNNQTQSIFYSSDGGATWGHTCAPSNNVFALGSCTGTVFGSDPALFWNDNNEVFLNYMLLCGTTASTKYSMVVARSADGGATWVKQGIIKNAWSTGTLEDKNFYVIDNTATSSFYGRHYTCWDRSNNEKFAYSSDNGLTWTEVDLPTAPVGGVDLACEIAVGKNGTVHVVFDSLTCGVSTCSDERMFYTRSTNGGVSWSAPVQVQDFNLVGFSGANKPPVADNRGISPFGAVDIDNSGGACDGTLYATFSDWTSGGATENDIWVRRSTDNGATWSAAVKVNDDGLAGRTQFHPFLQVDQANGNVVVAWHDTRNDSTNKKVDYYAARSTNCGVSFEANVKASQPSAEFNNSGISYSDENTTDNPNRNPNQYGEYMGLAVVGGKAHLAWLDSRHFYPGSSTDPQKENVGFAAVDFGAVVTPVCGNNLREAPEVCDGTDLAGQTCVSQGFSGGTLSCNGGCTAFVTTACTTAATTVTFTSNAAQDGRVVESSETSNVGGTVTATSSNTSALRVGDTNADAQYKSFVSFDTSSIPDGASIQSVTLRLRRGTSSGTNPFTTHGSLVADVSSAFSGNVALEAADFQAAATATAVCTLSNAASNGTWSECTFNAAGLAAINKTGTTQVRVAFTLDDNDDLGNDYIGYYSGDNATAGNRPQLVVTYQ